MRIAVIGAGGTGGFFGGVLAKSGREVVFITRGPHLEAMRRRGLTLKSRLVGEFAQPVQATDDPHSVGPVDLILFCVKTYDTVAAAEQMRPLIGPQTVILPMQNGVESAERIAQVVGSGPVLGGVAYVFSSIEAPGVVAQTAGPGRLLFGELSGGTSPRTERLLPVFAAAGIAAELRSDIRLALWEKFVNICAASGVTALTRLPIGAILACAETSALFRGTMEEVEAVGRACGIDLPVGIVDQLSAFFANLEPWARGSLAHDLATGRRLELEALNGAVVRLGRAHGLPTPLNFVIYAALKPYVDGAPALP
jgi:2-dehydropantoate 2-reductase